MPKADCKKLQPLRSSDTIGVFATSSALAPARLTLGLEALKNAGYAVELPLDPSVYYGKSDHGFACESPERRAQAFNQLVSSDRSRVLLAARGAYGTLDVLPLIDFEALGRSGKAVIGCSDVTALLLQVVARSGLPAIHGATLGSSFADFESDQAANESVMMLLRLLTDPEYRIVERGVAIRGGCSRGKLLGGNLTMLLTLLGTAWDVDYSGAILFVEDVGEAPYRIHRAFTQLKLAGKLENLAGLIFGRFAKCESTNGPSMDEVFSLIVRDLLPRGSVYPVVKGLEFGHWGKNVPLPLGCLAEINGDTLTLLESPIG